MGVKVLIDNKKARFLYFIEDTLEVGVELIGCEVKSLRAGEASLADSYAEIENEQMYIKNFYIKEYAAGSYNNAPDTRRARRLLAHKQEIKKYLVKVRQKGLTLIPLKVYLKDSLIKIELGLCRGKHAYDKKDSIKERDIARSAARERL